MNSDIDFDQFIKLLDGALASDDKNVKQALRKFLFVAAMVIGDDCEPGPFTKMMDTIDSLQHRVASLENQNTLTTTDNLWVTGDTITNIGTGASPTFPPTTTTGGTTGSVTGSGSLTAITPPTTSGSITSTGYTTYTNPTSSTGTITLPMATSTTVGTSYTISGNPGNTTTSTLWYDVDDPKTGTSIKEEIKESLKKLATFA